MVGWGTQRGSRIWEPIQQTQRRGAELRVTGTTTTDSHPDKKGGGVPAKRKKGTVQNRHWESPLLVTRRGVPTPE